MGPPPHLVPCHRNNRVWPKAFASGKMQEFSVISQRYRVAYDERLCLGLAQPFEKTHLQCVSRWEQVPRATPGGALGKGAK